MAWFETWFNTPYYHILYKDRDFKEAEFFISLLVKHLQLPENSNIIDLACGKGRHSLYLNQLGYDVLGLDLSDQSIAHNKKMSNEKLKFEVHDMREKINSEPVDAVFNLFTSFGYFEDPNDDAKVFSSVSDVLKKEGFFVLDFLNRKFVENTLVPETIIEKEGIAFTIKKRIENCHVIKDILFEDNGEQHHYFEKVKLHSKEEITNLAEKYDLEKHSLFGNYDLSQFDEETSPRCIMIFRKK